MDYTKIIKRCNRCQRKLPIEAKDGLFNFSKRNASKDGFTYTCKECEKAVAMESYYRRRGYKQAKQAISTRAEDRRVIQAQSEILPHIPCLPAEIPPEVLKEKEEYFARQREQTGDSDYIHILERDSKWKRVGADHLFLPVCQLCNATIYKAKLICVGQRRGKDRIQGDPYENKIIICHQCNKLIIQGGRSREDIITRSRDKCGDKSSSETGGDQKHQDE